MLRIAFICSIVCLTLGNDLIDDKNVKASVTVQATNNTQVPSITYVVSAVDCLQEAYSIYDNDDDRAELYAALFQDKYNGTWNVVVGYTALYIQSTIYVEILVSDDGKQKKDSSVAKPYLLFSSE